MGKFEEWAEAKAARLHQYSPSEIEAELLRQEIRELEKTGLDPDRKNEIFANADKIQKLKSRLAVVSEYADLSLKGREVGKEMFVLAKHAMENSEWPPDAEVHIEKYLHQMSAIEEKEKAMWQEEREWLKRSWLGARWVDRTRLVRWYAKATFYRTFRQALPRAIARIAIKSIRR